MRLFPLLEPNERAIAKPRLASPQRDFPVGERCGINFEVHDPITARINRFGGDCQSLCTRPFHCLEMVRAKKQTLRPMDREVTHRESSEGRWRFQIRVYTS